MQSWLEFARGPLFLFAFSFMLLGLLRHLLITSWQVIRAMRRAGDRSLPYRKILVATLKWLLPLSKIGDQVIFSLTSILFHVAILIVPIFLAGHITLWARGFGISWPAIPSETADLLTVLAIASALALVVQRAAAKATRSLSRFQDYALPLLIAIPFVSGYLMTHPENNPFPYDPTFLVHLLSANLLFVLIPLTKLSHMVLLPEVQLVSEVAWHWPEDAGSRVAVTLGKGKCADMRVKGILTDTTLCTGCEKCVEACREENNLGKDLPRRWKRRIDDLSATRFTTIVRKNGDHFIRRFCRHCQEPACVSACIVGALTKTEEGPVTYDSDKCIGCRYCMMACPYGIPRYDWEKVTPYVKKCTMCYPRLQEGREPACVEACPEKATIFGTREELLSIAHQRIEENPDRYIHRVFGETEIGGTSILYLSDIPLDFLAFKPDLGDDPLPQLTWAALSKVPPIVVGMGGLMTGVWWIVNRRMTIAEEKSPSSIHETGDES